MSSDDDDNGDGDDDGLKLERPHDDNTGIMIISS